MLGLQVAGGLDVNKQATELTRKIPVFLISGSQGIKTNGAILKGSCGTENGTNDMRLAADAQQTSFDPEIVSEEKMI